MIGAMGRSMLKITAKYADTWNSTLGEWGGTLNKKLENTFHLDKLLDEHCEEIGRDHETLRRFLLMFGVESETGFFMWMLSRCL
jgi:hypothetical protein